MRGGHQIERMNIFTCPVLGIKIGNQVKWTMILSTDLNKACGNTIDAHEAAQMHQNFSQQLLQDHIAACSLPEHNLISVSTSAISRLTNTLPGILKKLLCYVPVDGQPPTCAVSASEWTYYQSGQPALRSRSCLWRRRETQDSNYRENDIKKATSLRRSSR